MESKALIICDNNLMMVSSIRELLAGEGIYATEYAFEGQGNGSARFSITLSTGLTPEIIAMLSFLAGVREVKVLPDP